MELYPFAAKKLSSFLKARDMKKNLSLINNDAFSRVALIGKIE